MPLPPAETHQGTKPPLPLPPPPTSSSLSRLGTFARCRSGTHPGSSSQDPLSNPFPPSTSSSANVTRQVNAEADTQAQMLSTESVRTLEMKTINPSHQNQHIRPTNQEKLQSHHVARHIPSIQNLVEHRCELQVPKPVHPSLRRTQAVPLFRNAPESSFDTLPQSSRTFSGLVRSILSHPTMPILIRELHETMTGSSLDIDDRRCATTMRLAAEKCATVRDMACRQGIDTTATNHDLLDVYFAALTTGISALRSSTPPPVPQPLHAVLSATNAVPVVEEPVRRFETSRVKIPERSKAVLEKWFTDHFDSPYPTEAQKKKLARETGLRLNQINNYFGNRRMRTKRKRLEQDGRKLAHSNGMPYATSVLAPRTKWRTIVRPSGGSEPVPNEALEANKAHNSVVSALLRGEPDGTEREEDLEFSPVSRGSSSGHAQTRSW